MCNVVVVVFVHNIILLLSYHWLTSIIDVHQNQFYYIYIRMYSHVFVYKNWSLERNIVELLFWLNIKQWLDLFGKFNSIFGHHIWDTGRTCHYMAPWPQHLSISREVIEVFQTISGCAALIKPVYLQHVDN
jgi:hypothetical protein